MLRAAYKGMTAAYTKLHGVSTVSDFQRSGRLTPQEFVLAGDELCEKVPVWEWVGGPEKVQPYLPAEKKCLVYRSAPCLDRAPLDTRGPVVDDTDEDGFVTTEQVQQQPREALPKEKVLTWGDNDDDDDDESDDPDVAPVKHDTSSDHRVYDVYILYDEYEQTPCTYLVGYYGDRIRPLTTDEMKQDVYHSNYGKTVTIDKHPVLGFPAICIHPCRHAHTMTRLMAQMKEAHKGERDETGNEVPFEFPVHRALFLFLKFISALVPTIRYDVSSGFDI